MTRISLTVEGLPRAISIIEGFEREKIAAVKNIVNSTATRIVSKAKANVPVDTGRLRSSIHMRAFRGGLTVEVGSNLPYAVYQEKGTGIFAVEGNGRRTPWLYYYQGNKGPRGFRLTRGNKPQPFLMPAYNSEKDNYVSRLRRELGV